MALDHAQVRAAIDDLVAGPLKRDPALAGLYSIGAGNRGIQAALLASGRIKHVGWVCHKLTPYARSAPVGRTCAARPRTHPHRHLPQGQPAVTPSS